MGIGLCVIRAYTYYICRILSFSYITFITCYYTMLDIESFVAPVSMSCDPSCDLPFDMSCDLCACRI